MVEPKFTDPGLFNTIYRARALRRFSNREVSDDTLFQLLDAAIRAPSGQNAQDWRFIVVKDQAVKNKMHEWSRTPWEKYLSRYANEPSSIDSLPRSQRLSLKSVDHLVNHFRETPIVIIVCGLQGRHSTPGGSAFPAVQNLLLSAAALGLSGSIFNFPLSHEEELRNLLSIPESNEIHCVLPIGYPTDRHGPLRRKPVADVVYMDRFGETWNYAAQQPPRGWGDKWLTNSGRESAD